MRRTPTGRLWRGRGGLQLPDTDAALCVHLSHLCGDREEVDDRADAEKPEG